MRLSNNLVGIFQTCYKRRLGTQTALLGVFEETRLAIEDRKMTMIVLFDFTKAFDCISHKLLLDKIHQIGIDDGPIRWLSSYLMNRKQSVRNENGCPTGYIPVALGVPQSSILGPLLFGLFICDLSEVLRLSSCRILELNVSGYVRKAYF